MLIKKKCNGDVIHPRCKSKGVGASGVKVIHFISPKKDKRQMHVGVAHASTEIKWGGEGAW